MKRTNERCYICDFSAPIRESDDPIIQLDERIPSEYFNSLKGQSTQGRAVYIGYDDKPVCNHCSSYAARAREEMIWISEAKSWRETNEELFKTWEELIEQPVLDVELLDETTPETTSSTTQTEDTALPVDTVIKDKIEKIDT